MNNPNPPISNQPPNQEALSGSSVQRLVRRLIGTRVDTVWHQDSPGVRVGVRRNNLTRLWRSPEFSAVGETHLPVTINPPEEMPINRKFYLPNAKISHPERTRE